MSRRAPIACLLLLSGLCCGASWPAFLGPASLELTTASLPLTWTETENVKWRIDLQGYGQSSPVIWDNQVYVSTIEGPMIETCHLSAYELATGKLLWRKTSPNPTTDRENNIYIARGAPTPLASASGVLVLFEGGLLQAYSHAGELRWQRNLKAEYGDVRTQFGLSASPIAFENSAIVWMEQSTNPYIVRVDLASGKDIWKVPGLGKGSWSTPVLLKVSGETHLVCSADGVIRGFKPSDGSTLWTLEGLAGNTSPSPCVVGEGRFLMGASPGQGPSAASAVESNCLIEVSKNADGTYNPHFVWKAERATSSFGSPAAHLGVAYFINRQGICYGLDLATGQELFAERTKESLWATPLAVGDRVYIVGNKGWTTVLQAGKQFKVLAENRLYPEEEAPADGPPGGNFGGKNQYAVAAVPGSLLIRVGDSLYCLGKK